MDHCSASKPQRHSEYYFDDGNVIFRVEDLLFKVHRYFFVRDSPLFQTMFSLPPGEGNNVEGLNDERPIRLPEITAEGFEAFLWVLYPPIFGHYEAPVSKWCSVLTLATRWEFESIRQLALSQLNSFPESSISPIDRIVLAHRLQLSDWILPPYVDLVCRSTPLTIEEGRKLSLEDVILLSRAREEVRRKEIKDDRAHEIYFGVRMASPWHERQSVWDIVADVLGIPQTTIYKIGAKPVTKKLISSTDSNQ